jgi:AdoMet-dependent rRNA methyltransferase SPB1
LVFDDEDGKLWLSHSATTEEIKLLCQDLKVLSKGDFKALMKWREKIRAYRDELRAEQKVDERQDGDDHDDNKEQVDDEAKNDAEEKKVDQTIAALQAKSAQVKRKEKKKKREEQRKAAKRMALNANNLTGADLQDSEGQGAFSLRTIPV